MSRMAPFIDGGISVDRTNWSTTVLSYYTYGGAIAAGLDLALRDRSDGHVTLDDFMRAMWQRFGKPGASRDGYVDRPYTMADAEATLGEVSGDRTFAHEFFAKYITGREILDYGRLLDRAGLVLRRRNAGRAWLGDVRVDAHGSRVATLVAPTWPAYGAGLEQDAEQLRVDGTRIAGDTDLAAVLRRHKPGDRVPIAFVDRAGRATNTTVTLAEDPALEIVTTESAGGALSAAQRGFRERWLKTRS
jgi:predicted metalloprotease with PDZ domain